MDSGFWETGSRVQCLIKTGNTIKESVGRPVICFINVILNLSQNLRQRGPVRS